MARRTCATDGCAEPVQRRGARCPACRRYLRTAAEHRKATGIPEIKPLDPATIEDILALIDNALRLLTPANPEPRKARTVLYAALAKAEPWRTLREEILTQDQH